MKMAKLRFMQTISSSLVLFMTIINQTSSARILTGNIPTLTPTPTPTPTHHHNHHKITFLMHNNMLNVTHPSSKPATTKLAGYQLPFQKPLGLFPPNGGIPLLGGSNPTTPATQTLDLSNIGLSFPNKATLQELEFGTVTLIDEELLEGPRYGSGSPMVGKAQGIYVASSEDGSSHMMAMTANFAGNEFKDGLRFFGVHQSDDHESHIAIIGGTGKYQGANGYATVKAVNGRSNNANGEGKEANKLLLFNVYLS